MKKFLFSLLLGLLILTGCGDAVEEDLLDYINNDMEEIFVLEDKAVTAYESATGANYTDDLTLFDVLVGEVIPTYEEFIKKLEKVDIETKELKAVHKIYIEGANIQYDAFLQIVDALIKQDPNLITEANAKLAEARDKISTYQDELYKLADAHDVVIE